MNNKELYNAAYPMHNGIERFSKYAWAVMNIAEPVWTIAHRIVLGHAKYTIGEVSCEIPSNPYRGVTSNQCYSINDEGIFGVKFKRRNLYYEIPTAVPWVTQTELGFLVAVMEYDRVNEGIRRKNVERQSVIDAYATLT